VLIVIDPPQVLFCVFVLYAVSGPIGWLMRLRRSDGHVTDKPRA